MIINNKNNPKMNKMKILTMFIALFTMTTLTAQVKPEKKAQKIAAEMTEVLSLNEKEKEAIYQIQLERFKESQVIQETYADQPEEKKAKLKALGNKVFNQIKEVLGEERQKKWKEHNAKSK